MSSEANRLAVSPEETRDIPCFPPIIFVLRFRATQAELIYIAL